MYDVKVKMTTSFDWDHVFDGSVLQNKDFLRFVGEAVLEDSIDGEENDIFLIQSNIFYDPAYYSSIVMRFHVKFYQYLDNTKTEKVDIDWIQVVVICNYNTIQQMVIVNKVHSYSMSECLQFQSTPKYLSMGWKNSIILLGYHISYFSCSYRSIFVNAVIMEADEYGYTSPGIHDGIPVVAESYPFYISRIDRGLVLL